MAIAQELLFTQKDYQALPDTGPRYELVEGELIVAPSPNHYHQVIAREIVFLLTSYLKTHPIGEMLFAPFDVYLDEINVFQPDILYFSNDRRSILTKVGVKGAPDLVIEILSPSNANRDREIKRKVYARSGVIEFWIVSPDSRTVEIYRLQEEVGKPVAVRSEQEVLETPLLPSLQIKLSEVFGE